MGYISNGMGDHFSAILVSLMVLRLTLVDRNPFLYNTDVHITSEFILLRISASFVAILGRKDAHTLWSRVAMTHRSCIIAHVFAVNIGEIRRSLFRNQVKRHIYCVFLTQFLHVSLLLNALI